MSFLADYHGPETRSRAMSLHQTSVYAGTALGGVLAGFLGERYGWRSPFWLLGFVGMVFAPILAYLLVEPKRTGLTVELPKPDATNATRESEVGSSEPLAGFRAVPAPSLNLGSRLAEIIKEPAAVMLLATFAGANFVAATLLSWLPDFVFGKFSLSVFRSAVVAALFFPAANLVGALVGGLLADRAARRPGGRIRVQAAGLLLGAPFILLAGATGSIPALVVALVGIGLGKGVYDSNIFASFYDVVPARVRGTAAGLMNTVGWSGASLAPVVIGAAGDRVGMSRAIGATALVYLASGLLAIVASVLASRRKAEG
jgi:MFS family permease